MKKLFLVAIKAYQKYLSPYKGFCCAHKFHEKKQSCSAIGYRAIRKHGVVSGLALLKTKLSLCKSASETHRREKFSVGGSGQYLIYKRQAGFVDGCDCGDVGGCADVGSCDMPNPCDCSIGDWFGGSNAGKAVDVVETVADGASEVLDSVDKRKKGVQKKSKGKDEKNEK